MQNNSLLWSPFVCARSQVAQNSCDTPFWAWPSRKSIAYFFRILKCYRYRYRSRMILKLRKVIVADGPVGVLPPPSSCQFAPCMLASLSVCVCVHGLFAGQCHWLQQHACKWEILAETRRDRVFLFFFFSKTWAFGCNFPQRPVFLAHCSWEVFLDFWPVSLSLSFSGYKQEQRQWKGMWEVGPRRAEARKSCRTLIPQNCPKVTDS